MSYNMSHIPTIRDVTHMVTHFSEILNEPTQQGNVDQSYLAIRETIKRGAAPFADCKGMQVLNAEELGKWRVLDARVSHLYNTYQRRLGQESASVLLSKDQIPVGLGKGWEGKSNSCHLDALMAAMFMCTTAFDWLLSDNDPRLKRDENALKVQQALRAVVTEYRQHGFVNATTTNVLREALAGPGGHAGKEEDVETDLSLLCRALVQDNPLKPQLTYGAQLFLDVAEGPSRSAHELARREVWDVQTLLARDTIFQVPDALSDAIDDECMIILPREGEGGRYSKGVIPSPIIEWANPTEKARFQLLSVCMIGDYDPSSTPTNGFGEIASRHYKVVSFDKEGNGYLFDSMAERHGGTEGLKPVRFERIYESNGDYFDIPIYDENQIQREYNVPQITFVPHLLPRLQFYRQLKLDEINFREDAEKRELDEADRIAIQCVSNAYVCAYKRLPETEEPVPSPFDVPRMASRSPQLAKNAMLMLQHEAGWGNRLAVKGTGFKGRDEHGALIEATWDRPVFMEHCEGLWMLPCEHTKDAEFKFVLVSNSGEERWEDCKQNRTFKEVKDGNLIIDSVRFPSSPKPSLSNAILIAQHDAGWGNRLAVKGTGFKGRDEHGALIEATWDKPVFMEPCEGLWMLPCEYTKDAEFKFVLVSDSGRERWEDCKQNRTFKEVKDGNVKIDTIRISK
jgi:hypothetical protein